MSGRSIVLGQKRWSNTLSLPVCGWIVSKGLEQHTITPELVGITKAVDTNNHSFMTRLGLSTIGAKQAIPSR